jgi:hypothetical protein
MGLWVETRELISWRLATVRHQGVTRAAHLEGDEYVLFGHANVGALPASGDDA